MPEISFSKAKLARKCTQAYDYKYHQRLRRKRKAAPLYKGEILHSMIEARNTRHTSDTPESVLAGYEKKYAKLFREEQEEYGDLIGDMRRIYAGYQREYKEEGLTYQSSEEFIATDLGRDIRFIGYVDNRAIDKERRHWLMERKTHRTIPDDDKRFSDLQTAFYVWAYNREHENKVDGIIWDYIRSKPPTIPEQLVKGGLSQRKNMDTDYHTYLSEIKRLELDPEDYKETLDRLKGEQSTFFKRVYLPTPPKVLMESVANDLRTTAVLIKHLGKTAIVRNMTHTCPSTCEFFQLCQAEVRGMDGAFVRKTEYEEYVPDEHKDTREEEG